MLYEFLFLQLVLLVYYKRYWFLLNHLARFIQQTKQEELSRVKQKPTKRSSLLSSFTLRQQKKVNEIEELQHIESTIRSFNVTLANKNIEELTSIVQSAEAISFVALQLCRNANRSLMKLGVPIEKLPGKTKDSLLGGGTNNHMSSQTALKKMPNLAQQSPLAKPLSSLAPPQKPSLSIPAAQSPTSSDDNIEDIFSIMDKQAGLLGAGSSNDVDKINSFEDFANETQFLNDLPDMVEINAISNIAANTIPSSQAPRAQPKFAQPPPPQFMPRPPTQPRPFGTQQPSLPSVPPSQSYGKTAQRMCLLQTPPQPPQHPHLPPAPMQPPMQQPYQQNALSYEDSLYMWPPNPLSQTFPSASSSHPLLCKLFRPSTPLPFTAIFVVYTSCCCFDSLLKQLLFFYPNIRLSLHSVTHLSLLLTIRSSLPFLPSMFLCILTESTDQTNKQKLFLFYLHQIISPHWQRQ